MKNFESNAASLVRGLPFNQVKSANANGAGCSVDGSAGTVGVGVEAFAVTTGTPAEAGGVVRAVAEGADEAAGVSVACFALSCDSSSSMRCFIASSSFSSAELSPEASGVALFCGEDSDCALDERVTSTKRRIIRRTVFDLLHEWGAYCRMMSFRSGKIR